MKDKKPIEKSLHEIDKEIQKLSIQKSVVMDKYLSSDNPDEILKAKEYIATIDKNDDNTGNYKVYMYSPEREFFNGLGFKSSLKSVSYDISRKMGEIPIISSIVNTRIDQIMEYMNYTQDTQRKGWTINKRLSLFDDTKKYKLTDNDKREIEKIVKFVIDGGYNNKWDINDDFDHFVRKFVKDSLELDQACGEYERNRRGQLVSYTGVDGATIRYLETIDPQERDNYKYGKINGYNPIYCQVYNQKILYNKEMDEPVVFYPWELSFGIRNRSSSLQRNSYGKSEIEILVEIITYLLWGTQYNGNFFKQGSSPKGFLTLEGNVNDNNLNELRSSWRQTVMGVQNSHKLPIFRGGKDSKITWTDMQVSNKDMEFQQWNEFLMLTTCSVFRIDPSELGYRFKNQGELFGQQGQKERIEHSKDKGLKPLLTLLQKEVNKYIVSELNSDFEFKWTGIDIEDETAIIENDAKKLDKGMMSMEDAFEKYSGRKFNPDKDTILNSVYWQAQQAKNFGSSESNLAVDEMAGENGSQGVQNPFDEYEKSIDNNPILSQSMEFFNKAYK